MTISKTSIRYRLYKSFGIVLFMVLVLFASELYRRACGNAAPRPLSTQAMLLAEATDKIRFQMMQNRLYLSNYLLSGDTREIERMNEGSRKLADSLQNGDRSGRFRTTEGRSESCVLVRTELVS